MTPPFNGSAATPAADEISLGEIWAALRAKLWLIVVVSLLGGSVAAGIAYSMTPIYRAQVVVLVVEDGGASGGLGRLAGQFGGLASLAGVNVADSGGRSEALGTLGSRQLIESYIQAGNLVPVLFYKKWDESLKDWKPNIGKKPTLWDATEFYTKQVRSISEDKKSGLVTLTIDWNNATVAAQWANELVRLANKRLRERAIAKSEGNLAYLNTQLEKTSVIELRQSIYRLLEAEVKNVMVAQGSDEYAFKVIDPAVAAEKKSKPMRMLIAAAGLILGFMLACFYALLARGAPMQRG